MAQTPQRQTRHLPRRLIAAGLGLLVAASAHAQVNRIDIVPRGRPNIAPPAIPPMVPTDAELMTVRLDPVLVGLARQLESPRFQDRQAAMETLETGGFQVRELCALLDRALEGPEARYRVIAIIQRRLLTAPQGALGISFNRGRSLTPGVEVNDLVPGLPAEEILMRGDRITQIDGQAIFDQQDLMVLVQSRAPGDTIALVVQRPQRDAAGNYVRDARNEYIYDTLDVELPLGAYDDLENDSNRGTVRADSVVARFRDQEARAVVERFGPRFEALPLNGPAGEQLVMPNDQLVMPNAGDALVESNATIQLVLNEREMVDDGRRVLDDRLRARWTRQLERLWQRALAPGLPADEADLRRRIAERYGEIISGR